MKSNVYKFTVNQLEDSNGKTTEESPLIFEASCHEDLFMIAEKIQEKVDIDESDATAFAVGMKLCSGVMMKNGDHELMKQLMPHFVNLMKTLKNH